MLLRLISVCCLQTLFKSRPFAASLPGKLRLRHMSQIRSGTSKFMLPKNFNPIPFPYHSEIEVEINDLTNLGHGVGRKRLDDGSNWVVLVPFTIPGEIVICRVFRNFDSYSEADLVSVIRSSADRIKPLCPHFANCGGCQYQVCT